MTQQHSTHVTRERQCSGVVAKALLSNTHLILIITVRATQGGRGEERARETGKGYACVSVRELTLQHESL